MKGRIAVTVVVGIVLIAYTTGASLAVFNAETTNPTNKFASGTLVLSNKVNSNSACLSTAGGNTNSNANTACDTLFSLSVKKPGDSGSGNLTLQNVGSLAASALKLYTSACADADATGETYHGTGSICGVIQLTIQQWTSNTFASPQTCIYGGGTASTCDWSDTSKTLGAYATAHTGSANAQTIGSGLASGAFAYITVSVKLPTSADNTVQGRSATIDLVWHIDQ